MNAQSFLRTPESVGVLRNTVQMERDGIPHGTSSGYGWHKCRCAECKGFKSAQSKARYERTRGDRPRKAKNPDTVTPSERMRLWRLANPEKDREQRRRYSEKHREELNRKSREWHRDNYEKSRATSRAYWQTEAGKANRRAANFKRRAGRLRNLDAETREYLKVIATDPCSYCGGVADTVDHIVALSRGGENHWTNMTAACLSCNSRKHNKSLLVFLLELNTPNKIEVA